MIGIDVVETGRVRRALDRWGQPYLERNFTAREIAYCCSKFDTAQHLAGKFAGKEAVLKAFGAPKRRPFCWRWIEVLNDRDGKPFVELSDEFLALVGCGTERWVIQVSITHTAQVAAAIAAVLTETPERCPTEGTVSRWIG